MSKFYYLNKDDSVLQLGANIGTSCILVDKVINGNNICVEPNLGLIPILKKNKEFNKAKYGSFISKSGGKIVKNINLMYYLQIVKDV